MACANPSLFHFVCLHVLEKENNLSKIILFIINVHFEFDKFRVDYGIRLWKQMRILRNGQSAFVFFVFRERPVSYGTFHEFVVIHLDEVLIGIEQVARKWRVVAIIGSFQSSRGKIIWVYFDISRDSVFNSTFRPIACNCQATPFMVVVIQFALYVCVVRDGTSRCQPECNFRLGTKLQANAANDLTLMRLAARRFAAWIAAGDSRSNKIVDAANGLFILSV